MVGLWKGIQKKPAPIFVGAGLNPWSDGSARHHTAIVVGHAPERRSGVAPLHGLKQVVIPVTAPRVNYAPPEGWRLRGLRPVALGHRGVRWSYTWAGPLVSGRLYRVRVHAGVVLMVVGAVCWYVGLGWAVYASFAYGPMGASRGLRSSWWLIGLSLRAIMLRAACTSRSSTVPQ